MGANLSLPFSMKAVSEATEALFRGLLPVVRVVEACELSLLGAPVDIQGIPENVNEKKEALERMTSQLEMLNPYQAFRCFNAIVSQLKMHYFSEEAFESLIASQLLKKEKYIWSY